MWCFPNRKLIVEIFKGVCWRTYGLQQGLTPVILATCGCQLRKNVPWPFTTGDEIKLFFWIYLSVTQKEASLPNTPIFGSWTVAIHGDSMCLRMCVYPPSANTLRSGTSPVAVCALVLPRGTIAWPVFMFVSFSCPWNRRPSPSPEETQAKTKPNEETKRLTDKAK